MTQAVTPVDRLFSEFNAVLESFNLPDQISESMVSRDQFRKSLLLAAASFFENRIADAVLSFVSRETSNIEMISSLVRIKVVKRQYHTWFDWEHLRATPFYAMFGDSFKAFMTQLMKVDEDLKNSVQAFLELGNERNRLVHQDFATFQMEKTLEEVYDLYKIANVFVEFVPNALKDHADKVRITTD
jgi:hypothetical protein